MNTKQKIVYTGVIALTLILSGQFQTVEAAKVETSISMPYKTDNNISWSTYLGLALIETFWEDIFDSSTRIQVNLSKAFHFVKEDNSITGSTPTLSIGKTLRASTSDTTGYWGVFGNDSKWSGVKNKPFGNDSKVASLHDTGYTRGGAMWSYITTNVFSPDDNNSVQITSGNPSIVECTNTVCTAKSAGTTNVTVSFPISSQSSYQQATLKLYSQSGASETITATPHSGQPAFYGASSAYGRIKFAAAAKSTEQGGDERNVKTATYDFPSITYTITVPPAATPANQPQAVTCDGIDTITNNSANIKWTYTDQDDLQASYSILVATDPNFTQGVKQVWQGLYENVATTRNRVFQGLDSGVTYYAAVTTWNASNSWSPWATCPGNFKTVSNGAPIVTYKNADPIASDSATVHWTYSDPEGDVQTEYEVGLAIDDEFEAVPFVKIGTGTALSASFTGLLSNKQYYVRVRAKNAVNGMSEYSIGSFTTGTNITTQPFFCSTSNDGDPVYLNPVGDVYYTAYPFGGTYTWNTPNPSSLHDRIYDTHYSSLNDNVDVSVTVTKDGITKDVMCPNVVLTCRAQTPPTACVNNTRTVYSFNDSCVETSHQEACELENLDLDATFSIHPDVADSFGSCYFSVTSENASSCTVIKNRTGETFWTGGTSIEDEPIPVGTYTLSCKQTVDSVLESFGTKSCYSNPDIREN